MTDRRQRKAQRAVVPPEKDQIGSQRGREEEVKERKTREVRGGGKGKNDCLPNRGG